MSPESEQVGHCLVCAALVPDSRLCGIRLRGGECMVPGGGCRLVEFTAVVYGCMGMPFVYRAFSQLGCCVDTRSFMSPGDFSQEAYCFRLAHLGSVSGCMPLRRRFVPLPCLAPRGGPRKRMSCLARLWRISLLHA